MANEQIGNGLTSLGIEFGSTRIKAVLLGDDGALLAAGNHDWENSLENGMWTYSQTDIVNGLQDAYSKLKREVSEKYGIVLSKVGSIGISAMMHGYLAFDKNDRLLVPFRTWRNTITAEAAGKLTTLLDFHIPQRWSIAHLEQAILNEEEHVKNIAFLTTLAGYVHFLLTGERVLGVGDASGMFPIDSEINDYDQNRLNVYDDLHKNDGLSWKIRDILPKVLFAGEKAGVLSEKGAFLLDPEGNLLPGIPLCPPEGDAGTGMTATNSVEVRTGNVSAGTSVFAMIVLERALSKVYTEIDMVTTPDGKPVAMVHCNNCTSDIDAWVKLFSEVLASFGAQVKKSELYDRLYAMALDGEKDCGGVLSYNLYSGEPILNLSEGRPMLLRQSDADLRLSNVARSLVFSSFAALKVGMNILTDAENVTIEKMLGHGGLFKTEKVAQSLMASALQVPIAVMPSASEGGAWGIAILAQYLRKKEEGETLSQYLNAKVFSGVETKTEAPQENDTLGFNAYLEQYLKGLPVQKAAAQIK